MASPRRKAEKKEMTESTPDLDLVKGQETTAAEETGATYEAGSTPALEPSPATSPPGSDVTVTEEAAPEDQEGEADPEEGTDDEMGNEEEEEEEEDDEEEENGEDEENDDDGGEDEDDHDDGEDDDHDDGEDEDDHDDGEDDDHEILVLTEIKNMLGEIAAALVNLNPDELLGAFARLADEVNFLRETVASLPVGQPSPEFIRLVDEIARLREAVARMQPGESSARPVVSVEEAKAVLAILDHTLAQLEADIHKLSSGDLLQSSSVSDFKDLVKDSSDIVVRERRWLAEQERYLSPENAQAISEHAHRRIVQQIHNISAQLSGLAVSARARIRGQKLLFPADLKHISDEFLEAHEEAEKLLDELDESTTETVKIDDSGRRAEPILNSAPR